MKPFSAAVQVKRFDCRYLDRSDEKTGSHCGDCLPRLAAQLCAEQLCEGYRIEADGIGACHTPAGITQQRFKYTEYIPGRRVRAGNCGRYDKEQTGIMGIPTDRGLVALQHAGED